MKTFFIFLLGTLLTVTAFAADRRPTVTISGSRDYEIVIDGRRVINNNGGNYININDLRNGRHRMEVYEMRRGLFGRSSRRISASEFTLRNNDLNINIDRFGTVRVFESGYGRNNNGYGDNDDRGRSRDWNNGNNHGQYPRY